MHTATTIDPIAALRAEVRWERTQPAPVRLWRSLASGWLGPLERRVEAGVRATDHAGVLEDYLVAARR